MRKPQGGPAGPLVAGAVILGFGIVGLLSAVAVRGTSVGTSHVTPVRAPSARSLRNLANAADRAFFPGTNVLAVYTRRMPGSFGGTGQVIAVIGRGSLAEFFIMEYVMAPTPGTVRGTNESGWTIFPVTGTARLVPDVAALGRGLGQRVTSWLGACGARAQPVAVWPFSDGALAVARLDGQYVAAQFSNASPRQPGQLMGPAGSCSGR